MVSIRSNMLSMVVQRSLARATGDLSRTFEQLSSGKRINRASDDAAGLAISSSLSKDQRLSRTAIRNVNDGISVVNIVDAALGAQKEIVIRMGEIAEQSANGTYSSQQREVLQKEYLALQDEFDRIADATEFNGITLLRNQSSQSLDLMAGITGADTSLLRLAAANSHRFAGMVTQKSDANEDGLVRVNDIPRFISIMVDPRNVNYDSASTPGSDYAYLASAEQQDAGERKFRDSNGNEGSLTFLIMRATDDIGAHSKYDASGESISVNPVSQYLVYFAKLANGEQVSGTQQLPITASQPVPATVNIGLSFTTTGTSAAIGFDFSSIAFESYDHAQSSYTPSAIGFTNVLNQHSAKRAVTVLGNKVNELSALQGQYGAIESRLNVAQSLLSVSGENFAAAASRITDVDIATASADSVRQSILQRTASALLAQANQAPQLAIELLRNT